MPDNPIDITGKLTDAPQEFTLRSQGKTFPTVNFNTDEANILNSQMNEIMASMDSSVIRKLTKERASAVANAATFSKQIFDEKMFGGVNAQDNEIGFSVLRPGHVRADPASGSVQNDWYFNPSSPGWNDWIGDGSTNDYTVGEDQVTVVFGLVDQDVNTEVSAINVDSFGRNVDMLPQDLNDARLMDNETDQMVQPLPTLVAQENDSIHIRLRHDQAAESQPRLLGFTFGLGSFLNKEDF